MVTLDRVNSITGITGLLLGIGALAYASINPTGTVYIATAATLSLVLLARFFFVSREYLRHLARKEALYMRLNNALMILLALFAVLLINLIVRQYYFRLDLSATRLYTLAPKSIAAAAKLERGAEILYFGVEGSKEYQRFRDLLEIYRYHNRKIVYTLFDLDRSPLKAREFGVIEYNTLVYREAGKILTAKGGDEEAVTNLLIRGARRKVINIRFLQGHNERSLSETDRDGYGKVLRQLTDQGYDVRSLDLKGGKLTPAETDLLIIASPGSDLTPAEYGMLWNYQDKGGKLLVMIDSPRQLEPLFRMMELTVLPAPVFDSQNVAGTGPSAPLVNSYPKSAITRNFGLSTVFPGVYGLMMGERMMLGYSMDPLVITSPGNWLDENGNRKKDPGEEGHPFVIAGIVSHVNRLMKMVVYGDADFASNAYASVSGNANLFINTVSWLCDEGGLVSVAPAKNEFVPMFISDYQARIMRLLVTGGIPFVIIVAGTVIWQRRRRL